MMIIQNPTENFQASRTSFTAASMPRFRSMGFIPATTLGVHGGPGSPNGQMGIGGDFSYLFMNESMGNMRCA